MGSFFGSGISGGGFDPTALGGIPETDPGINVAGNSSLLDSLSGLATGIGSSISGVLNTINYGNAQQLAYQQAVPLAQARNTQFMQLLLIGALAFVGIKLFGKKK